MASQDIDDNILAFMTDSNRDFALDPQHMRVTLNDIMRNDPLEFTLTFKNAVARLQVKARASLDVTDVEEIITIYAGFVADESKKKKAVFIFYFTRVRKVDAKSGDVVLPWRIHSHLSHEIKTRAAHSGSRNMLKTAQVGSLPNGMFSLQLEGGEAHGYGAGYNAFLILDRPKGVAVLATASEAAGAPPNVRTTPRMSQIAISEVLYAPNLHKAAASSPLLGEIVDPETPAHPDKAKRLVIAFFAFQPKTVLRDATCMGLQPVKGMPQDAGFGEDEERAREDWEQVLRRCIRETVADKVIDKVKGEAKDEVVMLKTIKRAFGAVVDDSDE